MERFVESFFYLIFIWNKSIDFFFFWKNSIRNMSFFFRMVVGIRFSRRRLNFSGYYYRLGLCSLGLGFSKFLICIFDMLLGDVVVVGLGVLFREWL